VIKVKIDKNYLNRVEVSNVDSFRYNSGLDVKYPVLKGVLDYIGEKLDKYVFKGVNEILGYGYEPETVRARNSEEQLYVDEPVIEIKRFDPEKSKKKVWAYTSIERDGAQTIYLPDRDKVRKLLPEEFWHYVEGGTLKVKDKYIKVKRKFKDAVGEFLNYLLDHELTHPKYLHLKNEEKEEIHTEVDTVINSTPDGKSFREYIHAYGLIAGDWLSKKIASVKDNVKKKAKEYKNYMESLGFDLQPAEVGV